MKKYRTWTNEELKKEALLYDSRTKFARGNPSAYLITRKRNILDNICSHMPIRKDRPIKLTEKNIKEKALKCKTKSEFKNKYPSAYVKASLLGILEQVCSHMPRDMKIGKKPHNFKWTKKKLKRIFGKFDSKENLRQENEGAYQSALTNGFLEELTSHMKKSSNISNPEIDLLKIIKMQYPSAKKLRDYKVKITNKPYISRFEIDIFIPELNKGVEFDGKYWHSFEVMRKDKRKKTWPNKDIKDYHKIKDDYFQSVHGIEIIHIKEEDWGKNKNICVEECFNFLNKNEF